MARKHGSQRLSPPRGIPDQGRSHSLDRICDTVQLLTSKQRLSTPVDPEAGIVRYEDSTLLVVANIIVTVLSSLLPIISIIVLYSVKKTSTRLGITVIFTTLFAATLFDLHISTEGGGLCHC